MNSSIIVLIVLIIIVLLVILLLSPTCKNTVNAIFKKQNKQNTPVKAKAPMKTPQVKNMVAQAKDINSPDVEQQKFNVSAASPFKNEQLNNAMKSENNPNVEFPKARKKNNYPIKMKKIKNRSVPQKIPVLTGAIEDFFNPKIDIQAEFGITEEQLLQMAKEYKKRNLEVAETSVPRHRSLRRKQVDKAETVLRNSFMNMAINNRRIDTEEFTHDVMKDNIVSASKRDTQSKRSKRTTSFRLKSDK